jgi:MFS family permease
MMAFAMLFEAVALALLPWAGTLWLVLLSSALQGLSAGPFDIALFTLRQRRTDPAWYGRAFSVSMSMNYAGNPLGSALAGPLISWSLAGALWAAVAITGASIPLPLAMIPAHEERRGSAMGPG